MRIINDEPNIIECTGCKVKLEYDVADIQVGAYGCAYVECPKCGELIFIDSEVHSITLTKDNIQFPQHFWETGPNAVNLSDRKINQYVRECIDALEKREENYGEYALTGSGNTMVFAVKYEDEYAIYVTKGYYESSIPRQSMSQITFCDII